MTLFDYIDYNAFFVENFTRWSLVFEIDTHDDTFYGTFSECMDIIKLHPDWEIYYFDIDEYPECIDLIADRVERSELYKEMRNYFISDEDYEKLFERIV